MRKLPVIAQTFALLFTMYAAKADDGLKLSANNLPKDDVKPAATTCRKVGVVLGLDLGTQGIGLELKVQPNRNWSFRAGGSYLPAPKRNFSYASGNVTSNVEYTGHITNFRLLADWHTPFLKVIDFKITGGVAYFTQLDGRARFTPQGNYYYGDILLSPTDIGYVDANVDWSGFAPYLGVSLFHTMPAKRVNLNLDLGTYYLNKPEVSMVTTGFLTGNESNQPVIEDNLKGYRWFPLLQVSVNYRLY